MRERVRAAGAPRAEAGGSRGFVDGIDPDLPAIVAPAPEFGRETPGGRGPGFPFRFAGFTLIQLDDACLRERLLPSLAAHHFAADGEWDYGIRVDRQGSPADVVYTSDPAITADGPADATVGLFSIRLEDATESDLAALPLPRPNGMRRREGPSPFGGGGCRRSAGVAPPATGASSPGTAPAPSTRWSPRCAGAISR